MREADFKQARRAVSRREVGTMDKWVEEQKIRTSANGVLFLCLRQNMLMQQAKEKTEKSGLLNVSFAYTVRLYRLKQHFYRILSGVKFFN